MTSFKKTNLTSKKDTLSTDFLLIWLFFGVFAIFIAVFIAYPLISSIITLVVLIVWCYEEPQHSIHLIQQLKQTCFGILYGEEETAADETSLIKDEEENSNKLPLGRFRFAKLLLTNQVPLMANYFEQKSSSQ
jgi:hypothetical protein